MTQKIQTRGLGSGVRHRFESVSTTWCLLSHNTSVYQLLFPSFHILPLPLSSQFQTSCLCHQTNLPLHRFTSLPSKGFQCLRESSTSNWNTEACNRPSRPPTTLEKWEGEKLDKQTKTYFLKAIGNHRFKKKSKGTKLEREPGGSTPWSEMALCFRSDGWVGEGLCGWVCCRQKRGDGWSLWWLTESRDINAVVPSYPNPCPWTREVYSHPFRFMQSESWKK